MNLKLKSVYFVLVIMVAVAIGWWLSRPGGGSRTSSSPVATESLSQPSAPIPSNQEPQLATKIQPFAKTPYLGLKDPRWIERKRLREIDPSYQWRTPIEFFGKVIDEQGRPVEGATIELSWSGTVEKNGGDGVGKRTMLSDTNGWFHIHGIAGKGMTVYVKKAGYYTQGYPQGSYEYAGFWEPNFIEPDRNNPVVFHLVKRPVAEPTYRVRQRSLPKPPTWETRIDLLAEPAETNTGGDLLFQISRSPNVGYEKPFDWQLKIEGQSGAEIVITEEEFMLHAPGQGYQNVIVKDYKDTKGGGSETVKFYVRNKTRSFYAAVTLEITCCLKSK